MDVAEERERPQIKRGATGLEPATSCRDQVLPVVKPVRLDVMRGASTGRVTVAAHLPSRREALEAMLYAAIDIHKRTFHAAVLDVETGETAERRFDATREELNEWAMPLQGNLAAVAIEATTGWRWVWRELSARGFDVRLVDPAQAKALRGRIKRAKTDRPRWLCVLLAKEMLPESGYRRRRSRRFAIRHGCARHWRTTAPAGRNVCTRC
jgi:hypothetical protein